MVLVGPCPALLLLAATAAAPAAAMELGDGWRTTTDDGVELAREQADLSTWTPLAGAAATPTPGTGVRWLARDVEVAPESQQSLWMWTRGSHVDLWVDGRHLLSEEDSGEEGRAHQLVAVPHELTRDGRVRLTVRVEDSPHAWQVRQSLYGSDVPVALGDPAALDARARAQTLAVRPAEVHAPLGLVSLLLLCAATALTLARRRPKNTVLPWLAMGVVLLAALAAGRPLAWLGWTPVSWLPTLHLVLCDLVAVSIVGATVRVVHRTPGAWAQAGQWVALGLVLARLFLSEDSLSYLPAVLDQVLWGVMAVTVVVDWLRPPLPVAETRLLARLPVAAPTAPDGGPLRSC